MIDFKEYLISLTASPSLEEPLVDWLLRYEAQYGFSSFPVNGHASRLEGLSLAEQVSGRKKQIRFQMHVPANELEFLLDTLEEEFRGSDIHYWVAPVLKSGHI